MLGMERTSEKVARLVWFCGAARAAFLRATGSLSVQVRLNANYSYIFLFLKDYHGLMVPRSSVCRNLP